MTDVLQEVLAANQAYAASFGDKGKLALPPARRFAAGVTEDVLRIRSHPLVPARIPIHGYIFEVKSGRLIEVEAATSAGTRAILSHRVETHPGGPGTLVASVTATPTATLAIQPAWVTGAADVVEHRGLPDYRHTGRRSAAV
jgi:hypothetical protein